MKRSFLSLVSQSWKRVYEGANRITHWKNRKQTEPKATGDSDSTAIVNQEVAPASKDDTYQKRQYRLDRLRYVQERREARCQKWIGLATLLAVIVYAGITLSLAIIAHEQLVYSERPWVGLGEADVLNKPTGGQPVNVRVSLLNNGKSPALNVVPHWVLKPWLAPNGDTQIPFPQEQDIAACRRPEPKWREVKHGGTIILPSSLNYFEASSPTLNDLIANLLTKKITTVPNSSEFRDIPRAFAPKTKDWSIWLYLVGCIDYFDQTHKPHRTYFCALYQPSTTVPNGTFGGSLMGNDAN